MINYYNLASTKLLNDLRDFNCQIEKLAKKLIDEEKINEIKVIEQPKKNLTNLVIELYSHTKLEKFNL